MSIFDKDIRLPEEELYDKCKEVCEFVIPRDLTHYRADKNFIRDDIIKELKDRDLYKNQYPYDHDALYKICDVMVSISNYIRLIPQYEVRFFYNKSEYLTDYGNMYLSSDFLTGFVVGINGVIDNNYEYL